MTDIFHSLTSVRLLDDLSRKASPIHRTHPLAKLLVTVCFIVAVASTSKREVVALLPFALYPFLLSALADLPPAAIWQRLLLASPLLLGIGILNPLFDREAVVMGGLTVGGGWLIFVSLLLKGTLTISAAIILIATTGMDGIGEAMRTLRVPKIIVLQVRLTYRYLSLLLEELARMVRAHELRSPLKRGIGVAARGSLPGHLLVRTYERGQRIYEAMVLRGFDGEYRAGNRRPFRFSDAAYTAAWIGFFGLARFIDLSGLFGSIILKAVAR